MHPSVQAWKDQGKFISIKDHSIFYFQAGKGDNLLLLHGYPYSSYEWKNTIAELSKNYAVTIFDFLCMGFSDKPKDHLYSYEEHADYVNELLHVLGKQETHLLSHDLGVSVAQELLAFQQESKSAFTIRSSAFVNGRLFMDVYQPRFIQRLLSQTPTIIGKTLSSLLSKKAVNASVREVFGKHTQPSEAFLDEQWEILNYNDGKSIAYLIGRLIFDKYRYQERWIPLCKNHPYPFVISAGLPIPIQEFIWPNGTKNLFPIQLFICSVMLLGIGRW